jgi:small subunit ribosomal protein S6
VLAASLYEYELVVVLSPDIPDDGFQESLDRLQQSITARGGEIVETNHWGRRRLAYPIKRHLEGNYVVSQIRLGPDQVAGLESGLRISEEVLRHLIVRTGE